MTDFQLGTDGVAQKHGTLYTMTVRTVPTITLLVAGVLFAPVAAQAIVYAPGETLNPACAPTDAECRVVGTGTGTVGPGVVGQVPYYAVNGSALSATSTLTILSSGKVGIGTTSPSALLGLQGGIGISNSQLFLSPSGNVDIGSTNIDGAGATGLSVTGNAASFTQTLTGPSNILFLHNTDTNLGSYAGLQFQTNEGSDNRRAIITGGRDTTAVSDGLGGGVGYLGFFARGSGSAGVGTFDEKMRITGQGKVGIGTISPVAWIDLVAKAGSGLSPLLQLSTIAASVVTPKFIVTNGGLVGIGTSSPAQRLDVAGTIRQSGATNCALTTNASGDIICTSDANLKQNISPFTDGLSVIAGIDPQYFQYDGETFTHAGFIAQNVQSVLPQATPLQQNGYLGLDTNAILAVTVNAVKQLAGQVGAVAQSLTTNVLNTGTLCMKKSDGTSVCVTGDELDALLNRAGN